jgi:hypothetical protein
MNIIARLYYSPSTRRGSGGGLAERPGGGLLKMYEVEKKK